MKILVPIKRVIDFNARIRVKTDSTGVETSNVKMSMNPFDMIALEEAVRWKEQGIATEIICVSIGTLTSQETLRTALAIGADRAVLVQTENEVQPFAVAKILQAIALQESPGVIILGKQAIDDDSNQVGQLLAAALDWPQATFVSKIKISEGSVEVVREVDGGLETLRVTLPAVITVDLRLNEPRQPTLPNIMKAKQKPLQLMTAEQLQVDISSRLKILKVTSPLPRKAGVRVTSVKELVDKLKNEAKVI